MSFAAPWWLVLLAPWLALAIYLLIGRRHAAVVPFVALWQGTIKPPRAERRIVPPPLAIAAMLLALLLAIVGAAQPSFSRESSGLVTVIVDRGITMSAAGRRDEVIAAARKIIPPHVKVDFRAVPPATIESWADAAKVPPTCIDTAGLLGRAASDALAAGPVVLLSDQSLREDPRIVRIFPTRPVANVAITRFAVRDRPTTQAMVTIRNDTPQQRATLKIDATTHAIDLAPTAGERSYFIDLPSAEPVMQAALDVRDDLDADNTAYLARQQAWPKIEVRGTIDPSVHRVVRAYQSARPAGQGSVTVIVAPSQELVTDDQLAIIAPPGRETAPGGVTVHAHAVTANLDAGGWRDLAAARPPSGQEWSHVIVAGSQPLVSVREQPARQAWIGMNSRSLAQSEQFVVLWTNALDWASRSSDLAEPFGAVEVSAVGPEWKPESGKEFWPGIYRRSDGAVLAVNAPPVRPALPPSANPAAADLLAAALDPLVGRHDLAPYLFVAAITCALLAAVRWPRKSLTPFEPARTV